MVPVADTASCARKALPIRTRTLETEQPTALGMERCWQADAGHS